MVEFWPSRLTLHLGLNTALPVMLRYRTACDSYIVVAKDKGPPSKTLLLMRQKRQPVHESSVDDKRDEDWVPPSSAAGKIV